MSPWKLPNFLPLLLLASLGASEALAQSSDPGRVIVTHLNGLVMVNTDGSNPVNITENAAERQAPYPPGMLGSDDWFPSVAADGTFAFQSAHHTLDGTHRTGARIYVMRPSGTIDALTTIAGLHIDMTYGMYPDDIRPAISRDGSKVCFIGARHEEEVSPGVFSHPWRDIYVVNTDGTGLHQVTTSQSRVGSGVNSSVIWACAWNPDGSKIAFNGVRLRTDPDGQERFHAVLATINPDGTGETHIPVVNDTSWLDGSSGEALDWSQDGRYILVAHSFPSSRYLIVDMAPGGGVSEVAPGPASLTAGSARLSPDSQRVVYLTDNPTYTAAYLTFVNRDGTNKVVVDTLPLMRYVGVWWMAGPAIPAPARLELTPNPVRIFKEGTAVQATATLYDAEDHVIVHGVRSWQLDPGPPPAQPAVSSSGAVVDSGATAVYTWTLIAANAGRSASTQVIVRPPSPWITLEPDSLEFGSVMVGGSLAKNVTVGNAGSRDLTVAAIGHCTGTSSEFSPSHSVPFTVTPGARVTIPVIYTPSGAGIDSGCLQFASNDEENPSAHLTVTGTGTLPPHPVIDLVPSSIPFGSVDVGDTYTKSTQVKNTGSVSLNVTGIGLCAGTSAEFSWSPKAPFQVAAGGVAELFVTYSPTDPGADEGCLSIASNDPVTHTRSLEVSGSGRIASTTPQAVLSGVSPSTDFDGDGRADLTVFRRSSGVWYTILSRTGTALSVTGASGNDVPVPGDYDGDGRTDGAVWHPSTGVWHVVSSSTGTITDFAWGAGFPPYNDVAVPGDYDGDGRTDVAVWRAATGVWWVINSSTNTVRAVAWGAGYPPFNDVPVPGDYDGDGRTDLAVWRPGSGVWWIMNSSTGAATAVAWGAGFAPHNDVPVPGDYDGDGRTDVAVWRASTGVWWVVNSSSGHASAVAWGAGSPPYNDVPIPSDYDGDGRTDRAVWRPSSGVWWVMKSSTGSVSAVPWGAGYPPYNDVPVVR